MQKGKELEIVSCAKLDASELADAMTEAFRNYVIPFNMNRSGLDFILRQRGFEKDLSTVVICDDQIAAFWLAGIKHKAECDAAYTISAGVTSKFRRRGFAKNAFEVTASKVAKRGHKRIVLEVIQNNLPALKLYESLGFEYKRALTCFRGCLPSGVLAPGAIELKEIEVVKLQSQLFDFWDWRPSWQNDFESLSNVKESSYLIGAFSDSVLCGYGAFTKGDNVLTQLFVHPKYRRKKIATSILCNMGDFAGFDVVRALNIDGSDLASNTLFERLGWDNYVNQYEMVYETG